MPASGFKKTSNLGDIFANGIENEEEAQAKPRIDHVVRK